MVDEAAVEVDFGSVGDDFVDDVGEDFVDDEDDEDEDEDDDDKDDSDGTEDVEVEESDIVVATDSADTSDESLVLVDDPHDAMMAATESATTQRISEVLELFMGFLR